MIDFGTALIDPIYASLGVPATLTAPTVLSSMPVTAIDDTAGVVIEQGRLGLQSIKPAASVRRRELTSFSVTPSQLIGGTITLRPGTDDEATWRIESHAAKPNPSGETAGEVQLILVKT